ncbi:hypothetical protein EDB84DRAFT_1438301 [Lactarius hengduanensis]|nr:hypothetical protein EDB84DRAFT_1438301 [Lactarius hengduanensis]
MPHAGATQIFENRDVPCAAQRTATRASRRLGCYRPGRRNRSGDRVAPRARAEGTYEEDAEGGEMESAQALLGCLTPGKDVHAAQAVLREVPRPKRRRGEGKGTSYFTRWSPPGTGVWVPVIGFISFYVTVIARGRLRGVFFLFCSSGWSQSVQSIATHGQKDWECKGSETYITHCVTVIYASLSAPEKVLEFLGLVYLHPSMGGMSLVNAYTGAYIGHSGAPIYVVSTTHLCIFGILDLMPRRWS